MGLSEKIRPSFELIGSKPKWMSTLDNIPFRKMDSATQAAHHINDLIIGMLNSGN